VSATVAMQVQIAEALLPASRGPQRGELLRVLAELYQLTGWLAFDQDAVSAATQAFDAAQGYAQAAGDAALMAYILGPNRGFAATYSGRPRDGVTRGQAALEWAQHAANPRLTAFVCATTARAHARLGDAQSCLALLGRAEDELDRDHSDQPTPDWLTVFDRAALHGHRGSCLLDLTRPDHAVDALEPGTPQRPAASRATASCGCWTVPGLISTCTTWRRPATAWRRQRR